MGLKKTIEQVISLTVANTTTTNSATVFLPGGKIKAVVAFFSDYSAINAGFVRASVKDANGEEVSKMQSIENYKNRQGGSYTTAKKPLPVDGGSNYTVTVTATAAFTGAFLVEFVFVYEDDSDACEI